MPDLASKNTKIYWTPMLLATCLMKNSPLEYAGVSKELTRVMTLGLRQMTSITTIECPWVGGLGESTKHLRVSEGVLWSC